MCADFYTPIRPGTFSAGRVISRENFADARANSDRWRLQCVCSPAIANGKLSIEFHGTDWNSLGPRTKPVPRCRGRCNNSIHLRYFPYFNGREGMALTMAVRHRAERHTVEMIYLRIVARKTCYTVLPS